MKIDLCEVVWINICNCSAKSRIFSLEGCGKTKKHAKHVAAQKMFEHLDGLRDLNTKVINECFDDYVDETKLMLASSARKMVKDDIFKVKEEPIETFTVSSDIELDPTKAIEKVQDMILKHNLQITYYEIEKKSFSGEFYNHLILSDPNDAD